MLLTRLELVIRRENLSPSEIARRVHFSRQHLLDIRQGKVLPSRRFIHVSTRVISSLARRRFAPADLYERADRLLLSDGKRLRHVHAKDLDVLTASLPHAQDPEWLDVIAGSGIGSETAAAYLIYKGTDLLDQTPTAAAAIFTAAARMAAAFTATPVELAASLHGNALRGRANARRHLGAYDDALSDLRRAAADFARARFCSDDAGRVEYSRGGILFKMEQYAAALAAERSARRHFMTIGDLQRVAHCDVLEAAILFEQGRWSEARSVWINLERLLGVLQDQDARARVWQNLGAVEIKLGYRNSARMWLIRAAAAFRRSGNTLELTRTRWNIASFIVAFRNRERGITALRRVQSAFDRLAMYVDAACVGLEILELRIEAPHADPVLHADAQATADLLLTAGLEVSGATALAALRRIAVESNRPPVIATVRSALRTLEHPCHPGWLSAGETGGGSGLARST